MEKSDIELLQQYRQGKNPEAFTDIFERYRDMVYSVCLRVVGNDADAEEIAQECFLKLLRQSDNVRTSVAGWLHRSATNMSIDRIRNSTLRCDRAPEIGKMSGIANDEPQWQEVSEHLDEALDDLPDELRAVVVEHYLRKKKQEEIAREQGFSAMTISRRLKAGVEGLRKNLAKRGVALSLAVLLSLLAKRSVEAAPPTLGAALDKMSLLSVAECGGTGAGSVAVASAVKSGMTAAGGLSGGGKVVVACIAAAAILFLGIFAHHQMVQRDIALADTDIEEQISAAEDAMDQKTLAAVATDIETMHENGETAGPDAGNGATGDADIEAVPEKQQPIARYKLHYLLEAPDADGAIGEEGVRIIENRFKKLGKEVDVLLLGGGISVTFSADDEYEANGYRNLIEMTGSLELRLVSGNEGLLKEAVAGKVPQGYQLLDTPQGETLLVSDIAELSGELAEQVDVTQNPHGFEVMLTMNDEGRQRLMEVTKDNVGERLAIILNVHRDEDGSLLKVGQVHMAAIIRGPIVGGRVSVIGISSRREAEHLAAALTTGRSPALLHFKYMEKIPPKNAAD